jgi:membrane protein
MDFSVEKVLNWPVIKPIARLLQSVKLPGYPGFSLFDLLDLYISGIIKGALTSRASSIAFSLFMALFPLLIFLLTLIPYLIPLVDSTNGAFDVKLLLFLESFLPAATAEYFSQIFEQLKNQSTDGLLSTTFVLSIFLVANGVSSIFSQFDQSYHVKLNQNFFKQYAYAVLVGLLLSLGIIIGAVAYIYSEFYIVEFGLDKTRFSANRISLLFVIVMSYIGTSLLYFFGTSRASRISFFSWGPLMTTLLLLVTSYLFGVYVDKFASYNELYGALGGLLILMVYLWLNSNILLLGFELNAVLARIKNEVNSKTE